MCHPAAQVHRAPRCWSACAARQQRRSRQPPCINQWVWVWVSMCMSIHRPVYPYHIDIGHMMMICAYPHRVRVPPSPPPHTAADMAHNTQPALICRSTPPRPRAAAPQRRRRHSVYHNSIYSIIFSFMIHESHGTLTSIQYPYLHHIHMRICRHTPARPRAAAPQQRAAGQYITIYIYDMYIYDMYIYIYIYIYGCVYI